MKYKLGNPRTPIAVESVIANDIKTCVWALGNYSSLSTRPIKPKETKRTFCIIVRVNFHDPDPVLHLFSHLLQLWNEAEVDLRETSNAQEAKVGQQPANENTIHENGYPFLRCAARTIGKVHTTVQKTQTLLQERRAQLVESRIVSPQS
jgi:hypothetical protein